MAGRISGLRSIVRDMMRQRGIAEEMEQNLIKEVLHLRILSALSDAGVLETAVFQGGTSLRLCRDGDRYSEDLDFACGRNGEYLALEDFEDTVGRALDAVRDTLERDFGIRPQSIGVRQPKDFVSIKGDEVAVAAWQLVVPVEETAHAPKSRIKIEFANVPAYEVEAAVVRDHHRLSQIQSVILRAETVHEVLADKVVALTARPVLKHRDVWDVTFLLDACRARLDTDMVARKFEDYRTADVEERMEARIAELATHEALSGFRGEMSRFLPAARVREIERFGLEGRMLARSADILRETLDAGHRPRP